MIGSRQSVVIRNVIIGLYKPGGCRFVGNDAAWLWFHKGMTAVSKEQGKGRPSGFSNVHKARGGFGFGFVGALVASSILRCQV